MPASTHYAFKQPTELSIPIWRYIDFTKLVSLLETRSLYFARADTLGDPFEGSYPRLNTVARHETLTRIMPEGAEGALKTLSDMGRIAQKATFINCWHMNQFESAAMWRLYAKTNEAVAIKSSYLRLFNALDSSCYVGLVDYIDFEKDWVPEGNFFYPFVHKRRSYAHEAEVRAVVLDWPLRDGKPGLDVPQPNMGIEKSIVLDDLIEAVHIAPTSPTWFHALVQRVCRRYSLDKPIVQSELDAEPLF